MKNLFPPSHLPIGNLAGSFNNVTASYKFLMLRAILDLAPKHERISMNEIGLRAISFAWFSVHYYKLSYGPLDSMQKWIEKLGTNLATHELLISELSYASIYKVLKSLESDKILSPGVHEVIKDFKNMVPYRLLSPWFKNELTGVREHQKNKMILELCQNPKHKTLYSLDQQKDELYIIIHPEWRTYLNENLAFLDGWWNWEFINFLQTRNSTVLAIPNKLQPPLEREMASVKKIFKGYFEDSDQAPKCFYSSTTLAKIHHDHFLPWSFLGSDILFNFVPCAQNVNSSKSNSIPSEKYLQNLAEFQFKIFSWLKTKEIKSTEEYVRELSLTGTELPSKSTFTERFLAFYEPLYLTARNQRFSMDWKWE